MVDVQMDRWSKPSLILVATDLTDLNRMMPFALQQAVDCDARLVLFHVLPAGEGITVDAAGMPYYDPTGALDSAQQALAPWCEIARRQNLVCDSLVREGNPAQQIENVVRQFRPDRILLGTRSRSKLGKLFIGSVAEQVLRSVHLPVMTVGPEAHLVADASGLERVVLHATSLREASRPSAALACQIAARQHGKLVLLHVLPPANVMERKGLPTDLDSAALHNLHILAQETDASCCTSVSPIVVHGNPAIEILAQAAELHASLIVLGATNRSVFQNLTRDRTIYKVLAHARCPVLSLRDPATAEEEIEVEHLASHR